MSPSRRTRTPERPAPPRRRRRKAALLLLCLALAAPLAYTLAQRGASASRQTDAAAKTAPEKRRAFVPGEILVRFRGESKAAYGQRESASLVAEGGRRIPVEFESVRGLEVVRGLRLARVPAEETLAAVESLRARPDVLYAEPNYVRRKFAAPNDPSYAAQWALKNTGQSSGIAGADIDAEPAWNSTTGSTQVVVGVVDEGVDINHPDLQANVWTNPGEVPGNGLDDDGSGYADDLHGWDFFHNDATVFDATGAFPNDETDAHGTHVAGIIGASGNNGQGVSGVNWNVKLLPLKILGREGESAAPSSVLETVRAYGYARTLRDLYNSSGGAKGANLRVLNNSYGGYGESQAERDAIRALGDAGVLFVAAAGNEGRSNDRTPVYPASYNEPNVITVGASTRWDGLISFSNYGPRSVHMAAPGHDILSTTPGGTYAMADGTSMAAPHVAGAAALVCAADPSVSLARLRAALLFGGERLQDLNPVNFGSDSRGFVTGRRLNAAGALAAAAEPDAAPPASIDSFHLVAQQGRTVSFGWTAPGDDGSAGRASLYEIRFSDTDPRAMGAAEFQRSRVLFAPLPLDAGAAQTVSVNVPFRHASGFVGIRAVDNAGNAGPVAAVAVAVAQDDADPYTLGTSAPEPLSTGGEKLNLLGDDLYYFLYQLPFDFPFFGQSSRGIGVSINGALYFNEVPRRSGAPGDASDDADAYTARLAGYRMVAALWDDLRTDLRTGGDVYVVKPDPSRVIFRWQGVTYHTPNGPATAADQNPVNFEVELRRDGSIVKRYGAGNAFVFPVVGISGGDPDTYVAETHTSPYAPVNLANAPTLVYTPRKPKPLPAPDVAAFISVTPDPATSGQLLTYTVYASDRSHDAEAELTRLTTQVPEGTSLVSVAASPSWKAVVNAPPPGATSGAITVDYGTISSTNSGTLTVVVQVNAPPGSTITNTANVQSYWQDPDPSNNTAVRQTAVVAAPPFANVRAVSAGGAGGIYDSHTVALKNDGTVWAWGSSTSGQLGDGTGSNWTTMPVLVYDFGGATGVSAGASHTLAVKTDGTVWGWGSNGGGQLGFLGQFGSQRSRPAQVPGVTGAVAVAAGGGHSLALKSDGTVWAWGGNGSGQVGNGSYTERSPDASQVVGLTNVKAVAAGPAYSLAVKADGTLWGWGSNYYGNTHTGVLGLPASSFSTPTPVQIGGITGVAAVAAGGTHVVAVKTDGTVWTWGNDQFGQLGDGGTNGAGGTTPRQISLSNVAAVAAGFEHSLALRTDGTVWSWGHNTGGALGDGTTTDRNAPVPVALGAAAAGLDAGAEHSAVVMADGSVRTWGANGSGQLGDRTRVDRPVPVQVSGPFPVTTPYYSPDGGSFEYPQGVMVACDTPGAVIHYTTNGADPTESDPTVANIGTLVLNSTTTLKARAYKPGWPASAVKSTVFNFPDPVATPTPTPVPGASAQAVAFVRQVNSPAGNGADIFLANADGTGAVNFTSNQGDDTDPVWSPDGMKIAYTCRRNPDGSVGGPRRVCVRNADGMGFAVLSQTPSDDFSPAWSPDGKKLAFASNVPGNDYTSVYTINADGTNRLPFNSSFLGTGYPDWSPDGQWIVYGNVQSIWIQRTFGGSALRLTTGFGDMRPRYSPDGKRIVFQSSRNGQAEIYLVGADGAGLVRLTTNPAADTAPAWSPDGSKIIFTSLRDNAQVPALYSMNPDGSNQTRLMDGGEGSWRRAPNAIDGSGFFVAQHYRDFLSREPDQSGLDFWRGGIDSCGEDAACREVKRVNTSAAFFLSIEFQETGYLVYRAYKAAYGNMPGKPVPLGLAEFTPDTQVLGQGLVVNSPGWEGQLEANKQNYFNAFVSRPRFGAAYPGSLSAAQFVDALNANAGPVLSASERETLVGGLANGTLSRAQVLRAVAEDADTQRQETNRAFVLMQYFGYLRRDPDAAPETNLNFDGYNFWLGKLDEFGGDWRAAEMVKAFLSSTEYRKRFGGQ
ncbi:MAG TPA: S8 family serine peptidase [Pyrinomonadaceae bacterium]|jgi:alpha-tubulin suppressor-like RCC1 family protein/subtilisin family serine protease/Tol biopolymer transport system component